MIKVRHTFQHQGNVVCKGKLVLIKQDSDKGISTIPIESIGWCKPIIISETEEIEVGGKYLVELFAITNESNGLHIEECKKLEDVWCNNFDIVQQRHKDNCKKILVLPEHFSPEQLQLIVDGKLKDGDEVMVECTQPNDTDKDGDCGKCTHYGNPCFCTQVKFNQQNHITLLPVEKLKSILDPTNQDYVKGENGEPDRFYLPDTKPNPMFTEDKNFKGNKPLTKGSYSPSKGMFFDAKEESWDDTKETIMNVLAEHITHGILAVDQELRKALTDNFHAPKRKQP